MPEGVERPKGQNRFRIKREDVEKYGPSEDCNGCTRALIGDTARAHTEACRDRFALEFMKDGDRRVDRDIDRLIAQQEVVREVVRAEPVQVRGGEEVEMEDGEEVGMEEDHDNDNEGVMEEGEIMRLAHDEEMEGSLLNVSR